MYSGWDAKTMPQLASKLYEIAHDYGVKHLLKDVEEYLKANITDENICAVLQLSQLVEYHK
jgi:hypothetical protein